MTKALYFISLVMTLLSLIGFDESLARFMFANGSDCLMTLFSMPPNWGLYFSLSFFLLVIFRNKFNKKFSEISLVFILVLWILFGRTIAFFPDGRAKTGWFYFEFVSFQICNDFEDCDKFYFYNFQCEKTFLGFYRLNTQSGKQILFVGYPLAFQFEDYMQNEIKRVK